MYKGTITDEVHAHVVLSMAGGVCALHVMWFIDEQPINAHEPIVSTDDGSDIAGIELQLAKAWSPICFNEWPSSTTESNILHSPKAPSPMLLTDIPTTAESNILQ